MIDLFSFFFRDFFLLLFFVLKLFSVDTDVTGNCNQSVFVFFFANSSSPLIAAFT